MASRIPTFALLFLMAACATNAPRLGEQPDASESTYLQGITTRYSLRLDEAKQAAHRASALPGGLLAGDEALTLRAALFHQGDQFGLDLVLSNHDTSPVRLERSKILIRDNAGRQLSPTLGYAGAEHQGLRGRTLARIDRGGQPASMEDESMVTGQTDPGTGPTPAQKQPTGTVTASTQQYTATGAPFPDVAGVTLPKDVERRTLLPDLMEIEPNQTRAYWSYFSAADLGAQLQYPLYVTVTLNGRKMLLTFAQ